MLLFQLATLPVSTLVVTASTTQIPVPVAITAVCVRAPTTVGVAFPPPLVIHPPVRLSSCSCKT